MSHPDLPDGYYLAEQEGWSHAIFRHVTQYGKSHWRDSIDQRMPDPRTLDYVLTSVSAITAMKAALADMQARAEKAAVIVAAAIALRQAFADYLEEPTFCTESCYKGAQTRLDAAIKAGEPTEGATA